MEDFDRGLGFVLRWEGGKVDDPHDKGGRTNRGVTQRTYDGWRDGKNLPSRDVYLLEDAELEDIYRTLYWWVGKEQTWPLNLVAFDTAVLFGASRASGWLQAVTWLPVPATAQAWAMLCLRRERHRENVARDRSQGRFWGGWMNRLEALAVAAGLAPEKQGGSTGG